MPFELKETTFKNGMGFGGSMVVDHFLMAGFLTNVVLAGWCVNWSYQVGKITSEKRREIVIKMERFQLPQEHELPSNEIIVQEPIPVSMIKEV